MTALRLLGLGLLLACALVLGVEIWGYEPDTGVREEGASLMEVRRTGTVRAPMLVTGVRVAPYIGGQEAPVGLSAGEVTDTEQDSSMAGELELARWSRETPGDGSASVLAILPPPAVEPDRTGSERSERSGDVVAPVGNTITGLESNLDAGRDVASNSDVWLEGEITYYHPSLSGGLMYDGRTRYYPSVRGFAAAVSWPIGTALVLEYRGNTITVIIRDKGLLGVNHVDLSSADFEALAGSLAPGRVNVRIQEVR